MKTFDQLCDIEPRLRTLYDLVHPIGPADWPEWERIKKQLSRLVGWGAENIQISSTLDYETTVQAFLEKAEL